jgi:hypothetical protein
MPLYPQNATSQGACSPTPCSFIIFSLDSHLSLSRNLGMRHTPPPLPPNVFKVLAWYHYVPTFDLSQGQNILKLIMGKLNIFWFIV